MTGSKKKKLFLHIGMHKTGTSSIQYMLHTNISAARNPDFLFPVTGRDEDHLTQHVKLARAMRFPTLKVLSKAGPQNRAAFLEEFMAELRSFRGNKVIVSSEDFCLLTDVQVSDLGHLFSDFEVVPIIFIRNIADFKEKFFQTNIQFDFYPPEKLRDENFKFWEDLGDIDVCEMARRWSTIAHDGKTVVVNYDAKSADGQSVDSVFTFLGIVGLDPTNITLPGNWKSGNKSDPAILTLVKYEMIKAKVAKINVDGLLQQLSRLNLSEPSTLVSPAIRAKLDDAYREQLGRLSEAEFVTLPQGKEAISGFVRSGPQPVHIEGLHSLVFAIGRAAARTKVS
jgi:hypothetical protein